MAKDDATTPGGLLSKVVKFVRNPATNWSDLDTKDSDRENSYSKQALKEMIERKRRNDFVRKREFDMLRKLRSREVSGHAPGSTSDDGSARASFFQSSMPSKPDDRAMTLKKIDEIEAQMSMQWWKTKHGGNSSLPNSVIDSNPDMSGQAQAKPNVLNTPVHAGNQRAYAPTEADELQNALIASQAARRNASELDKPIAAPAFTPAVTMPAVPAAPARPVPVAATKAANKAPIMGNLAASYEGGPSDFSASKLFALDVEEVQHDPELEEAAIRFANSDDAGAEAGLLDALSVQGTRAQHEDTWFTVFDLYRATGQHDKFESLAIDFAGKFGRSAPIWFSMPDMVARMSHPEAPPASTTRNADWRSPAVLGTQSIAAMNAALAKATMPWCLDWSKLKSVDPAAVVPLSKVFASWAVQQVQLRFMGANQLDTFLAQSTPSGVRETSQDMWNLRMAVQRVTHRPDEFELTALDFCVTYEVSPPSWENARCEYKSLDNDGLSGMGQTIIGDAVSDSIMSGMGGFADTDAGAPSTMTPATLATIELSGQIQGDPIGVLEALEAKLVGADVMVISCAKLMRVDFSAAGTLLNWVSARQAEGRLVQFSDVHRLVAAFFHVIGISEHAKVVVRQD